MNTTRKHLKACKDYRSKRFNEIGYNKCELCNRSDSFKYATHHIVYASEKPRHPELHNERNLIFLCDKCEEWLHGSKKRREKLVYLRDLERLFQLGKWA